MAFYNLLPSEAVKIVLVLFLSFLLGWNGKSTRWQAITLSEAYAPFR